ncbi:MAG: bifunctional oligoribonuclease/PAP phosphatase NrnA [Candidatus Hodarchaeota archaeon]
MQGQDYKDRVKDFFQELLLLLDEHDTIVFISHDNMDPDAVGSILGMVGLLEQTCSMEFSWVVFPDTISKLSKNLLEATNIDLEMVEKLPKDDFLPILLDVQNIGTLLDDDPGIVKDIQSRAVIIDHHQPEDNLDSRLKFIDNDAQSNCELIFYLYEYNGASLKPPCSFALLAGILYDSGFFRFTNNRTLKASTSILESGVEIEDVRRILRVKMDVSERIARLKAGSRVEYVKIGSVVIAYSNVSMYEASACRGLVSLGADIALVLAEKDGQIRISARQTEECLRSYDVNLGIVMQEVGEFIGGTGGGHDMAAAANGTTDGPGGLKKAIKIIEDIIITRIENKKQSDKP